MPDVTIPDPPKFPDLMAWPSTIPGEITRGDWKSGELEQYLCDLEEYTHLPPEPMWHQERRLPAPDFETVRVPAKEYELLKRRAAACEGAHLLARRTLRFADNRDLARLRVLGVIKDAAVAHYKGDK